VTQILVPSPDLERAQQIISEYETDNTPGLEAPDADTSSEPDLDDQEQAGQDEPDQ
jgi:hypothetical protein